MSANGSPRLSRRHALSLAALAGSAAALAGCSEPEPTPKTKPTPGATTGGKPSAPGSDRLVWAQWPDYIDRRGKRRPTLEAFTAETGIEVKYREIINDNAEYIDKIGADLAAKRPVGADLITLTNWMAARLVLAEQVQPLGELSNGSNVISALAHPDWDPLLTHSMPWQAGLTGIAYDARRVDRAIGSIDELFTRSDLAGRVALLTEFADTVGMTMLASGTDPSAGLLTEVEAAIGRLEQVVADNRVVGFYGNNVMGALRSGRASAALAWSGDVLQAQASNPYLKFVVPEEGLMVWYDSLLVPAASTAVGAATQLIDYYYRPEVAAKVAAYDQYICPVTGAQDELAKTDPDLAANPLIFPDAAILDRSYQFPTLPAADDNRLRESFTALSG